VEVKINELTNPRFKEFLDYWNSIRGDRFAPPWKEFDLLAFDSIIISHISVVDVRREPLDFTFRFFGTAHVNAKGIDKTGKSIQEVAQFRDASPFDEFKQVMDQKFPLAIQDVITVPAPDGEKIPQFVLRLPLSDDGQAVDKIISLVDWDLTRS